MTRKKLHTFRVQKKIIHTSKQKPVRKHLAESVQDLH